MAAGDVMTVRFAELAGTYIELRRGLGYRSFTGEASVRAFARHLDDRRHDGAVPLEVSLDWATSTASADPCNPSRRLTAIRAFLRHLAVIDGATDVPPPGLLGPTGRRKPPHVYSDIEISDLMKAAARLAPAGGLRPHCYVTLFGLLACTGLRIREALALCCSDVDLTAGVITVCGKRGRTRLVPLHPTAVIPLTNYAEKRQHRYGQPQDDTAFFRTDDSDRISYAAAHSTFKTLRQQLGWTAIGRARTPRPHDLRHRMVVRRIQAWHAEKVNVDNKISALATYLGHLHVSSVYWYMSAVPELMCLVGERFEAFAAGRPGGVS